LKTNTWNREESWPLQPNHLSASIAYRKTNIFRFDCCSFCVLFWLECWLFLKLGGLDCPYFRYT